MLRHQVAVLKRSVAPPRVEDSDRNFWIAQRRLHRQWHDWLLFVRPETVSSTDCACYDGWSITICGRI